MISVIYNLYFVEIYARPVLIVPNTRMNYPSNTRAQFVLQAERQLLRQCFFLLFIIHFERIRGYVLIMLETSTIEIDACLHIYKDGF